MHLLVHMHGFFFLPCHLNCGETCTVMTAIMHLHFRGSRWDIGYEGKGGVKRKGARFFMQEKENYL